MGFTVKKKAFAEQINVNKLLKTLKKCSSNQDITVEDVISRIINLLPKIEVIL